MLPPPSRLSRGFRATRTRRIRLGNNQRPTDEGRFDNLRSYKFDAIFLSFISFTLAALAEENFPHLRYHLWKMIGNGSNYDR